MSTIVDDAIGSYIDDSMTTNLLELAGELSSSSSIFDDSNVERDTSYENVFNTPFMLQSVDYFAHENAAEFSVDEYLPPDWTEHGRLDDSCTCCLCRLREKNGCELDVCIRKHPGSVQCQQFRTTNSVCDACMESMTLISKRAKANHYRCIDDSCSGTFKIHSLRTHYLNHLKCKMYFCSFCPKSYNSVRSLKTHERSHANQ